MPTRRTSPRRGATRPSVPIDHAPNAWDDADDRPSTLAAAAPWLALLALVLAAGTLGYLLIRGGGADGGLADCRKAAWTAIPKEADLPDSWSLSTTDLNANGITVSILGADAGDGTNPPVVYASVTCYGSAAQDALDSNRDAADRAGANVTQRGGAADAWDITNESTGSVTSIFRVGQLIGQVADAGSASPDDLDTITAAVAAAMGDKTAAGTSGGAAPGPADSEEPFPSDDAEASGSPFAPELEALLPTSVPDTSDGASPGATLPLTVDSASAADVFGQDPSSRALAARLRTFGKTLNDLQVAQAFDETGAVDVAVLGFRLPGSDLAKLEAAILETWLSSSADGVKTTEVTLGGKTVTKVDYGDGSAFEYVYAKDDVVIVVETSDEAVATAVMTALK